MLHDSIPVPFLFSSISFQDMEWPIVSFFPKTFLFSVVLPGRVKLPGNNPKHIRVMGALGWCSTVTFPTTPPLKMCIKNAHVFFLTNLSFSTFLFFIYIHMSILAVYFLVVVMIIKDLSIHDPLTLFYSPNWWVAHKIGRQCEHWTTTQQTGNPFATWRFPERWSQPSSLVRTNWRRY